MNFQLRLWLKYYKKMLNRPMSIPICITLHLAFRDSWRDGTATYFTVCQNVKNTRKSSEWLSIIRGKPSNLDWFCDEMALFVMSDELTLMWFELPIWLWIKPNSVWPDLNISSLNQQSLWLKFKKTLLFLSSSLFILINL